MKRFILKIGTVLATAGFLAGATYAYFSSTKVTLTNIILATGTPEIQVSLGSGYNTTLDASTWSESNLYPGKESATHTFYLRNTNTSLPVNIIPTVSSVPIGLMGDYLQMQFSTDNGVNWGGYKSLNEWALNTAVLGATLSDSSDHQYLVEFRLGSAAPNSLTGQSATFTVGFEGHTTL